MATLEEIVVQLTAETSGLRAEMQAASKSVEGATSKMDKAIEEFSKNSSKNTSFFQQTMATMTGFLASQAVTGAIGFLADGVKALASELVDAGQEAMAEEQAFTRLATSLRLSGNYSKEAADGLVSFSNEMEGLAGVGADVIAGNLAILSSLTRLNSEGLQKAQVSAIELSAALGKDLGTTTEMVAKAINGNDMAFKKLGISMNLTSDTTKNLEIVTATLTERFGGSATAKLQTFGGALFVLKDAYGDMFKEVAKAITQNEVVISVMKAAADIFGDFTKQIQMSGSAVRDGIGEALVELLGIVESLISGFSTFFKYTYAGLQTIATGASTVLNGFMAIGHALDGNIDKAGEYFDKIAESAQATNDAWAATSESNFLDKTAAKVGELKNVAQTAFDEMKNKPLEAVKSQEALGNATVKTTQLAKEQADILKSFAESLASQGSAISAQYDFANQALAESNAQQMAMLSEDYAAKIQAQTEFFTLQTELRDAQYVTEQEALASARANNLITEQQFLSAKTALAQKYALDNAKSQTAQTQFEMDQQKQRAENFKSTMSTISSLSSSGNKELAAIGKAAAITNATIDGYAAVQKALASAPPPFNFALAGLVGAATAANVAKIAGVGLKGGIDSVPRSASGGNSGDNFPAILQPGERVVPKNTNQDLNNFLENQNQGSNVNISVTVMPGTGLNTEQIGNLIDQLNNYFTSGGLKLIGST
jgi:hypothetical protein